MLWTYHFSIKNEQGYIYNICITNLKSKDVSRCYGEKKDFNGDLKLEKAENIVKKVML